MKAKLKNGEIIKIADYNQIVLEHCDSYGNPIQVNWSDVKQILDDDGIPLGISKLNTGSIITDTIDWEQRRYEIAKEMLPVLCERQRKSEYIERLRYNEAANLAIEYADALIEELKKKK